MAKVTITLEDVETDGVQYYETQIESEPPFNVKDLEVNTTAQKLAIAVFQAISSADPERIEAVDTSGNSHVLLDKDAIEIPIHEAEIIPFPTKEVDDNAS